ncbi:MAG: NosD domain-containing protein, partial [Candidatus Korarchaeum sp.]
MVVFSGSPCASGDGSFTSLSSAVAAANPGDRILVCPGTYKENVRVTKSNIVIAGVGEPSSVIIEALNTTKHVIELINLRNVTISNLSLRGAIGSQQSGIYAYYSSESFLKNIVTTGNYFGLNLVSSSGIRVEGLTSENNTNAGVNLEGSIACTLLGMKVRGNRIGLISLLSSDIRVSRSLFSGNSEGGLLLKYSDNNTISYVEARENGWYGIYLQRSRGNLIANSSSSNNNALGVDGYGLYIYQGSSGNSVQNLTAERNVYGIKVYNSDGNVINASLINNSIAGVFVENSRGNRIGGRVSGSMFGVWIYGGGGNEFSGDSGHNRYGVLISESEGNTVRGASIHDNVYMGVVIEGNTSIGNVITRISSYNNTILGIDLGGDYVTWNDGKLTEGPNHLIDYPVLMWAGVYGGRMIVRGYINAEGNSSANPNFNDADVEIYQSTGHPSGYGEGLRYLGSLKAINGVFMGWIDLPEDLNGRGINITSLATLMPHGSSEFGPRIFAPPLATNLTLVKSVYPSVVTPGSVVKVSLLMTNYGNGTAYNVTLTDSLPEGMSYVTGTAKLNGSSAEPNVSGRNLSWILNIPPESSLLLEFNATVNAPPGTTLENLATFSSQEGSGSDSSNVSVISPPTIRVKKLASPTSVKVGGEVSYTVTISNSGDLPAFLKVSDKIPNGMSYVEGSFSSNVTLEGPQISGGEMRYNLSLGPRSSASVSYKLKAESEGRKENKVYVNGTMSASASVIVVDPPSPPSGGSGSGSGGSSGTPSCGYLPPPSNPSPGKPASEEKREYVLNGIP